MRAAGFQVEKHDDHFGPTTLDEVWLPEVARRGWLALTGDKDIRRVKKERDAAMRSGAALFFLIGKNHDEKTRNLVATAPRIIRFREKHAPPFFGRCTDLIRGSLSEVGRAR